MNYDQFLEALTLWREGRNQSRLGRLAILNVIRNRVAHPQWPNTSHQVILQPQQFSCFNAGDPNATKFPKTTDAQEWKVWLECQGDVLGNIGSDPTGGACYYVVGSYFDSLPPEKRAKMTWFDPKKLTTEIGAHRFYLP